MCGSSKANKEGSRNWPALLAYKQQTYILIALNRIAACLLAVGEFACATVLAHDECSPRSAHHISNAQAETATTVCYRSLFDQSPECRVSVTL